MEKTYFNHSGSETVVQVPKTTNGLDTLKLKLQESGFTLQSGVANRKLHLFSNDWPIHISWETKTNSYLISMAMTIPWIWIWVTISAFITIPPIIFSYFFKIAGIEFYALSAFTILVTVLIFFMTFRNNRANTKQRFDFSTNASWQKIPRRKWNIRLKKLVEDSFIIEIIDT